MTTETLRGFDFSIVPFDGHTGADGAGVTLYRIGETTLGLFRGRDAGRKERRLREAGLSPYDSWVGSLRADDSANLQLEGEWFAGKLAGSTEAIASGPEAEKLLRLVFGLPGSSHWDWALAAPGEADG